VASPARRRRHRVGGRGRTVVSFARWDVSDDQARELVGFEGKLPTTDRRPRFKLSTEQAGIVATLLEIDSALTTAGLDPSWLHKRSGKRSRSPLDPDARPGGGRGSAVSDADGIIGVRAEERALIFDTTPPAQRRFRVGMTQAIPALFAAALRP
jgi:hypothetical protein